MSTRRMEEVRIDHGAQFFTARDHRLIEVLADWRKNEVVIPWYDSIAGVRMSRAVSVYRGSEGMTSPAKFLARSFTVEKSFFVEKIPKTTIGKWSSGWGKTGLSKPSIWW